MELVGVIGRVNTPVGLISGHDVPLLPQNHKFLVELCLHLLQFGLEIGVDPQNAVVALPDLVVTFLGTLFKQFIEFIEFKFNLVDLSLVCLKADL